MENGERRQKSEVNSSKKQSAERPKRKAKKKPEGESPQVSLKSKVDSPKSEESNSEIDNPHSEIKSLLTANLKLQTETMEVHHHPQLEHNPKPWKEYILEGLMIFLAVTLGFFAESYREHLVENSKETQFIQTFVEDLKSDTAAIRTALAFHSRRMGKLDSLMLLLSSQKIKGHENELYFFGRISIRNYKFQSNDRTITQLKNSGSLRLIRNEQAADSIISYQQLVEQLKVIQNDDAIERKNIYPVLSRMFNPFVFDKMVTSIGIMRPDNNPPLRSYDQNIQLDLAFYIHQLKGTSFLAQFKLGQLNKKATTTIAF